MLIVLRDEAGKLLQRITHIDGQIMEVHRDLSDTQYGIRAGRLVVGAAPEKAVLGGGVMLAVFLDNEEEPLVLIVFLCRLRTITPRYQLLRSKCREGVCLLLHER